MDDHEARVLAHVTDPDNKPLTLKAMAKKFRVPEDEYPGLPERRQGDGQVGQARRRQGQDPPQGRALRDDHRDLPAELEGLRLRPARRLDRKADQVFIPVDAGRDASTGDEVLVKIVKRAKGPGFNPEGRVVQVVSRASGLFVGHYFEKDGDGLRQGRRDDLLRPDLRRRPRRQGGPARRQGRDGDGPLPHPVSGKGRG